MSTSRFLEVEAKFSVADSTQCPDLTTLPQIAAVAHSESQSLSAVYYDTEDLRLTRAKVTLRRRTGGNDDGWHIKLPGAMGRTEIRAALNAPVDGEYVIPPEILSQVRSLTRNRPLVEVAQVDNNRTETVFADEHGEPVAEFCDDRVTASSFLEGGTTTTWREWEVELAGSLPGSKEGNKLLADATGLLTAAGAQVADSPSKLASALGDSINNAPVPPSAQQPRVEPGTPAAAVVAALQENRDKLVAYDPRVRADEWDSVHQMRVATRELRSHLQTFHGIVTGPEIARIEEDLKALAGMLGIARDAEVVEERWQNILEEMDADILGDETRAHLSRDMGRAYRRAHRHVIGALNSQRYLDLLESLDELLLNPPVGTHAEQTEAITTAELSTEAQAETAEVEAEAEATEVEAAAEAKPEPTPAAAAPAVPDMDQVMAAHLNKAYEKLVRRHNKAVQNWSNPELSLHEREEYFHDMRKAAKKLRYAAEAAGKATDLKTKKLYKACKDMQEVLGDFQDAVTSRDKLQQLAASARRRGEDTFGYGVLYQLELTTGMEALDDYSSAFESIKAAFKPLKKKLNNPGKKSGKLSKAAKKTAKRGKKGNKNKKK